MSEEIKIIEDFLNYNKNKEISGVEINAVSKLLNSYYRQQKEIEELKKDKYLYNSETGEITKIKSNSISKDKIRAKIKELGKKLLKYPFEDQWMMRLEIEEQIDLLNELLEE